MIDPKALLDQFLGARIPGSESTVGQKADQARQLAKENPIATGAIVAVLLGTKAGRSLTGSALRLGGLAAVAGLGYQAWKNYQAGSQPEAAARGIDDPAAPQLPPPPKDSDFSPEAAVADSRFTLALVEVMIAAARADGHVDDAERSRILDRLSLSGLGSDAMEFLEQQLSNPVDLDGIVNAASNEAQRVELYTAARLAIEPGTRAERGFLDLLAGRLGLADQLVDHVEATVSAAKV